MLTKKLSCYVCLQYEAYVFMTKMHQDVTVFDFCMYACVHVKIYLALIESTEYSKLVNLGKIKHRLMYYPISFLILKDHPKSKSTNK